MLTFYITLSVKSLAVEIETDVPFFMHHPLIQQVLSVRLFICLSKKLFVRLLVCLKLYGCFGINLGGRSQRISDVR